MGKFFIVFGLILLGAGSMFFYTFRGQFVRCAKQYEPEIVLAAQQSRVVFADKRRSCTESYETLMSWGLCRQQSQRFIPIRLRPFIVPLVNDISLFLRDQEKDIEFYKRDHDERCKGNTYLMFYPPESE